MSEEKAEKPKQASVHSPQEQVDDTKIEESFMITKDEQQKKEEDESEKKEEKDDETNEIKKRKEIPPAASASIDKTRPKQAISDAKRKLETSQSNAEPSIKSKKTRIVAPSTKMKKDTKKATIRTREFSFARPTASSANRAAAAIKATPTPSPARKSSRPKKSPASAQRSSTPAPKTPNVANKTSRSNFSYTPYTGPLPPLTVQSSFAPKGSQNVGHETRTASPAGTKVRRNPRPTSTTKAQPGKANNGVIADKGPASDATIAARQSKSLSGPATS